MFWPLSDPRPGMSCMKEREELDIRNQHERTRVSTTRRPNTQAVAAWARSQGATRRCSRSFGRFVPGARLLSERKCGEKRDGLDGWRARQAIRPIRRNITGPGLAKGWLRSLVQLLQQPAALFPRLHPTVRDQTVVGMGGNPCEHWQNNLELEGGWCMHWWSRA